jgi:hypothetical protein
MADRHSPLPANFPLQLLTFAPYPTDCRQQRLPQQTFVTLEIKNRQDSIPINHY